jgi:hypothetical protein
VKNIEKRNNPFGMLRFSVCAKGGKLTEDHPVPFFQAWP